MAIKDWRRSREQMEREAIAALAELAFGDATDVPPRQHAALIIVTAHQVPELVEMGAFLEGDLDDDAMAATAVVVDIAAGWDDEDEGIGDYVAGLDAHDLERLASHARIWAAAVWEMMVPLSEDEKAATLASLHGDR